MTKAATHPIGPVSAPGVLQRLFMPADNSQLIVFRMLFGFLLTYHCISQITNGTVYSIFIEPPFTFNFIGFDFLQPLPGNGMYYYFGLMALLGVLIMTGAWYRIAMTGFAVLWTILYLMQKSNYNNHYYLILLLSWIMALLPAHLDASADVQRNRGMRSSVCPQWIPWLFIFQMAIIYFFAAIHKFSPDWLSGKFIDIRFSKLSLHPHLGFIYSNHLFQQFVCYSGILFDLLIVPMLIWKKTRTIAIIASVFFHLFNSFTFQIGIFPYLSLALLLFFIDPEKIRRFVLRKERIPVNPFNPPEQRKKRLILSLLFIYCLVQVLLPMRSWLFPGNVLWTEEGYRMSWRMMLRTKKGTVYFTVKDPRSGKIWKVEPAKIFQPVHMMWLSGSPDIIWQYARRIKKDFIHKGYPDVEIYAIGTVSMNRRPAKPLINPSADLAKKTWEPFKHSEWVLLYDE